MMRKEKYNEITEYIKNYRGLSIDCQEDMKKQFPDVSPRTLGSILSKSGQNKLRQFHYKLSQKAPMLLSKYYDKVSRRKSTRVLLDMAIELNFPPLGLSRIILNEKYKDYMKSDIKEMVKDQNLIPDSLLAANISTCIHNDNQDGLLIDMVRYTVGEEYELKLKELALNLGMCFHDENYMRKMGYDKTPDLKLAIPCLYKDNVINWFESKASFGDIESHSKYLQEQFSSYRNRFGPGMVIYWFGYHEEILDNSENGDLTICDTFPDEADLTLLKFDHNVNKS